MPLDENEILYESELPQWKIILSRVAITILSIMIVWGENWTFHLMTHMPTASKGVAFFTFNSIILIFEVLPLLYLVRYALTKKPSVLIYHRFLYIDDKKILFEDIKRIENNIQKSDRFLGFPNPIPKEMICLNLKNGESVSVDISFYSNGYLFRSICERIQSNASLGVSELNAFSLPEVIVSSVGPEDLQNEHFKKYLGSLFPNIIFLSIILFATISVLFLPIKDARYQVNLVFSTCFLAMFLLAATTLKYVLISTNYIMIRNYIYFWKTTIFRVEDVRRFQIKKWSSGRGGGAAMLIMTRDYKIYRFAINIPSWDDNTEDVVNELIKKNRSPSALL